MKDKRVKMT